MDTTTFIGKEQKEQDSSVLYQTRSPEMQEIIGGMPSWIIRWGVTVIIVLLTMVFIAAYFIKYPEIAISSVLISNSAPPTIVKSTMNASIDSLLVKNNDTVIKGQTLVLFETEVNRGQLHFLDSVLHELREAVDLEMIIARYKFPDQLEINGLESSYKDLLIAINNYRKYGQGNKKAEYLQKIQDNVKVLIEYIHHWKEKHILTSTVNGVVNFIQPLKKNYYASFDQELIVIIPPTHNSPIVTGKIPSNEYAKVKRGQKVLIGLDAFPLQEYGYLNANVISVSEVSINNEYIVNMQLSNNLTTTYKQIIPTQAILTGRAEIITDDKSVLDRLLTSTKLF